MTTKMYDAFLSDITEFHALWYRDTDGTTYLTFNVNNETDNTGRHVWHTRVVMSRYFSNHSVDTVRYNNKRYLIDSKVELVEAP